MKGWEAGFKHRRRRRRQLRLRPSEPIYPCDAEHFLYGMAELINNRLVAYLGFEDVEEIEPVLMAELRGELRDVAAMRLLPHGRPLKTRTLYRLLCIKNFRGSVRGNTFVRIQLWDEHFTRNRRSLAEIDRLAHKFHREAAVLLSRGEAPIDLLERIGRDGLES